MTQKQQIFADFISVDQFNQRHLRPAFCIRKPPKKKLDADYAETADFRRFFQF